MLLRPRQVGLAGRTRPGPAAGQARPARRPPGIGAAGCTTTGYQPGDRDLLGGLSGPGKTWGPGGAGARRLPPSVTFEPAGPTRPARITPALPWSGSCPPPARATLLIGHNPRRLRNWPAPCLETPGGRSARIARPALSPTAAVARPGVRRRLGRTRPSPRAPASSPMCLQATCKRGMTRVGARVSNRRRRRSVWRTPHVPDLFLGSASWPRTGYRQLTGSRVPAHRLLMHEFPRRVRARFGGETVTDTTPRRAPARKPGSCPRCTSPWRTSGADLIQATGHHTYCPFKGTASYWTVTGPAARWPRTRFWSYPEPKRGSQLAARLRRLLLGTAMDEWYDEDEARRGATSTDPYHRVDVRRSSRPVPAVLPRATTVLAQTSQPRCCCPRPALPKPLTTSPAADRPAQDLLEESDNPLPTAPTRAVPRTGRSNADGRKPPPTPSGPTPRAEGDSALDRRPPVLPPRRPSP